MMNRTYSRMKSFSTFEDRFNYLKLNGNVGESTFGFDRYLNQLFYKSREWQKVRNEVIIRDDGCDLGIGDRIIGGKVIVHHINPITIEDIEEMNPVIFDPEFLVCVSYDTHNAIHFGDERLLIKEPVVRHPNDTCPWK